jgi:hypothetical protein
MEFIDDHPVTSHRVRFKDRVEISETDAQHVRDGAVVVWIVKARCQPPSYHPAGRDSDNRYRFNLQQVETATVLTGDLREGALAYIDDPTQNQGRLRFKAPVFPELPEPVDEEHVYPTDDLPLAPERWDDDDTVSIYAPSPTQKLLAQMWGDE